MATSTFPAVKAALVSTIDTATDADIQVNYGHPGKHLEDESVVVGDMDDGDQAWASLGARSREEQYSIKVDFLILKAFTTQQEATERAFDVLADVETALRANVTLGVAGKRVEVQMVPRQLVEGVVDDNGLGFGAVLRTVARVTARI